MRGRDFLSAILDNLRQIRGSGTAPAPSLSFADAEEAVVSLLSAVEAASPQHAHDMRKVAAYIYAFVSSMAFVLVSTAYNILFSFYQFFFANCCVVYVRSFLCYNYSVLVVLYTHLTDLYHLNDGRCFWWRTSARPGHTSSVKWTRIQQRYSRLNAKRGICFMYTYIFANRIHNHTCSQLLPWFKE